MEGIWTVNDEWLTTKECRMTNDEVGSGERAPVDVGVVVEGDGVVLLEAVEDSF